MAENLSAALGWQLADAVRGMVKDKTQPSTGTATYVGTDRSGHALILFPGADQPTPVHGAISAKADVGSTVTYSLSNGQLSITGNATDPAVGESKASEIASVIVRPLEVAQKATDTAVGVARSVADAAKRVADATSQHFFTDEGGIHVTNATQEDWDSQHSGPNVLINSIGQLFRNGLTNLLSLLPAQTATDTFEGDGITATFELTETPTSVVSVSVGGVDVTAYTVSGSSITLATAPSDSDAVVVEYRTSETSVVVWDGLGNAATNVIAMFGEIVRIGRSTDRFIEIDSNGIKFFTWTGNANQQDAAISDKAIELGPSKLTGESTAIPATYFYNVPEGTIPGLVGPTVLYADSGGNTTTPIYFWNGMGHLVNLKAEQKLYASNGLAALSGDTDAILLEHSGSAGLWRLSLDSNDQPAVERSGDGGTTWESVLPHIESGVVGQDTTTAHGGYSQFTVDFDSSFSSTPTVVAGIYSTSSSSDIGLCSVAVRSVNTTGFTARIFNGSSNDRSPGFYWIAVG